MSAPRGYNKRTTSDCMIQLGITMKDTPLYPFQRFTGPLTEVANIANILFRVHFLCKQLWSIYNYVLTLVIFIWYCKWQNAWFYVDCRTKTDLCPTHRSVSRLSCSPVLFKPAASTISVLPFLLIPPKIETSVSVCQQAAVDTVLIKTASLNVLFYHLRS